MVRKFLIEISEHYTSQIKQRQSPSYFETILEIIVNQMKSTNNWLQSNIETISFYESQVIGNEISSYAKIINFLQETDEKDINVSEKYECVKLIFDIYEKYEYKFKEEYLNKSSEEQNDYIEYLLMPIYCVYIYLKNEL